MDLVDKIIQEAELVELKIRHKDGVSGSEHVVYPSVLKSDAIIKKPKSGGDARSLDKYISAYYQAPEIVAKVLKKGNGYLVIEKLDTKTFLDENKAMLSVLRKLGMQFEAIRYDVHLKDGDSMFFLVKVLRRNIPSITYDGINNELRDSEVADIWSRWKPLIMKAIEMHLAFDLHRLNVGYSKDGRLKMLDI